MLLLLLLMDASDWCAYLLPLKSGWRSDAHVLGLLGGTASSEFDSESESDDDDELCSSETEDDGEGDWFGVGRGPGVGVRTGPVSDWGVGGVNAVSDKCAAAARFDRGSATPIAAARPRGRWVLGAAERAACCLRRETA